MNKIEKISDDKKYYSESEFVEDIIKKVNEIIEVLNNLLSEPRTLKLSLDDAKKIKKELKNSRRELQPSKITPAEDEWKEELRFLYGDLYYRNEDGEFCRIVNEIDDLIDFISKLLKEKTFSKEELNRLSIWSGDVGSFGVVSDEDAELINKIYKLLEEENEEKN